MAEVPRGHQQYLSAPHNAAALVSGLSATAISHRQQATESHTHSVGRNPGTDDMAPSQTMSDAPTGTCG